MAQCKVVASVVFVAGQKYKRGDIIECANPEAHGTRLEVLPVVEEKPKPVRKTRAKKPVVGEAE